MDIANEIATYLADSNFGTLGTDIFVGQIPDNTNGIWVERIGGSLNNYVPVESPVVNIYAKNTSASEAVIALENIKRFIHRMHTTETDSAFIYSLLVIGDIEDVARDLEYSKVYKLSLQVMHRSLGVIS